MKERQGKEIGRKWSNFHCLIVRGNTKEKKNSAKQWMDPMWDSPKLFSLQIGQKIGEERSYFFVILILPTSGK